MKIGCRFCLNSLLRIISKYDILSFAKPQSEGCAIQHTHKQRKKTKMKELDPKRESIECLPQNVEFFDCILGHHNDTRALKGIVEYLHLVTALFGYDITKGLTSSTSEGKMLQTIMDRFCDSENDKVVLATIGSVLSICKILATIPLGEQNAGYMDFSKFCDFVSRLYGCDLSGYNPSEIQDFRYHVMAYLKGRTEAEREKKAK